MALVFNSAANYLSRATNLPSLTTFSMCGWFRTPNPANVAVYNYPFVLKNDADEDGLYIVIYETDGEPNHAALLYEVGVATQFTPFLKTADTWYFIAVTRQAGANGFVGYIGTTTGALTTASATPGTATTDHDILAIGNNFWGDNVVGRAAAIKIWDGVVLTANEINAERWQYVPRRLANLWGFFPLFNPALAPSDYGPLDRDLTTTGTLVVAEGPPIPFKFARARYVLPTAAVAGLAPRPLLVSQAVNRASTY